MGPGYAPESDWPNFVTIQREPHCGDGIHYPLVLSRQSLERFQIY